MSDVMIKNHTIVINTQLGEIELVVSSYEHLKIPRLGIDLTDLPKDLTEQLVNDIAQGKQDDELVEALARLNKIDRYLHRYLIKRIMRSPTQALKEMVDFERFTEQGYRYFPDSKLLLVKSTEEGEYGLVIRFLNDYRAKCVGAFRSEIAHILAEGLNYVHSLDCTPYISPAQASVVEKAAAQLNLPFPTVIKVLRLISCFKNGYEQARLFGMLEDGDFQRREKVEGLERRVAALKKEREKIESYRRAQWQEFVFLEDRGELLMPCKNIVIRLKSENAEMFEVTSPVKYEVGRYAVTGKLGRNAVWRKVEPESLAPSARKSIVETGKAALESIPEPYREKLSMFLVSMSLTGCS